MVDAPRYICFKIEISVGACTRSNLKSCLYRLNLEELNGECAGIAPKF
jgi:hypothetical protein